MSTVVFDVFLPGRILHVLSWCERLVDRRIMEGESGHSVPYQAFGASEEDEGSPLIQGDGETPGYAYLEKHKALPTNWTWRHVYITLAL